MPGALVLLLVAGVGFVYARSEWLYRRRWSIRATEIGVPTDSVTVALGLRLATLRGCNRCHGARLQGRVYDDVPHVVRLVAPNLARLARDYSVVDLERSIRHGVKPNGRSVLSMPADVFFYLNDADLGAIIAFLRSVTPATDILPATEIRVRGRMRMVLGTFRPAIAGLIDHSGARLPIPHPGDSVALGNYLVHTTCAGCHGADLRGNPDPDDLSPNLAIVAAYSRAEFTHLMRTGEPIGHRTLREMMANAATCCFSHFTDEEIDGIYAYLRSIGGNEKGSPPRAVGTP